MAEVQVEFPTGEIVWAEVPDDGPVNVAAGDVLHRLDLADLRATIQGVSRSTQAALAGLMPDEVSIEFGIGLTVKTGKLTSVLAEAGGTATITVTVAWKGGQSLPAAAGTQENGSGVAA